MKTFHLLYSASLVAVIACGAAQAAPLGDVPGAVTTISGEQIQGTGVRDLSSLFFISPSASVIDPGGAGGALGVGVRLRGIAPQIAIDIEGSAGTEAGSLSAWLGARGGVTIDDLTGLEIIGGGDLGHIYGSMAYRAALGARIGVSGNSDIFVEGIARGPLGSSPSDFGLRGGLRYFPGLGDDNFDVLRGPQGTLFGDNTRAFVGGKVTMIPGYVIPGVEAGFAYQPPGSPFDIGVGVEHSRQLGGDWESSAGPEIGYTLTPDTRLFGQGRIGTIGGSFTINTVAVGVEQFLNPNLSFVFKGLGRGPIGSFTEFGLEGGLRYSFGGVGSTVFDHPMDALSSIEIEGVTPYIGTSASLLPGGTFIPAVDFGVTIPLAGDFDAGLRGELGYQFPGAVIEAWGGGEIGFWATPQLRPYVFGDIGMIGSGFAANRAGVGGEWEIFDQLGLTAEFFIRGGLGSFSEGGVTLGLRHAFGEPLPPPAPPP